MPPAATLLPVTEPDFPVLRDLAETIWREHYAGIIPAAQIDFMLAGRLTDDSLRTQLRSPTRWLELLQVSGVPVGYCACELADAAAMDGPPSDPVAMKLGQLYVLRARRGQGLGRLMLAHVERRARDLGSPSVWLQVNKRNTSAIAFYNAAGFEVFREAVFDIGSGFVMDDYLMAKEL